MAQEAALILVEATPDMSRARDRATFEAWGGGLSLEDYLELEGRLRGHAWAREAAASWQLRAGADDVLCSCETYRMDSRCGASLGHSYGIASVYTEPGRRRRGHVSALLARLAEHLVRIDPRAQAMVLFSDVALETYGKSGFAARPALQLAFPALEGDPGAGVDATVREDELPRLLADLPLPAGAFAIRPSAAQIDWQLERERCAAGMAGLPRAPGCGARLGAAAILWTADHRYGELKILLLQAPRRAEAEALVLSARRAAGAAGLRRAVLWCGPGDPPWPGAVAEDRLERLEAVPMLRPLDPRVRAGDWDWIPRALWL